MSHGHSSPGGAPSARERAARRRAAKNEDARRVNTLDSGLCNDVVVREIERLRDEGIVQIIPEDEVYRHSPASEVFDSGEALLMFHRGWEAGSSDGD
jgi:hypothetical protein